MYGIPGNVVSVTYRIQRIGESPNSTLSASYNLFIINNLLDRSLLPEFRPYSRSRQSLREQHLGQFLATRH